MTAKKILAVAAVAVASTSAVSSASAALRPRTYVGVGILGGGEVGQGYTQNKVTTVGNIGGFFMVGVDGNLKITDDIAMYGAVELMEQLSGSIVGSHSSNFFAATDVAMKIGVSYLPFGATFYVGGGFRAQFNVASGGKLDANFVAPVVLVGGFKEFMDGKMRVLAEVRAAFDTGKAVNATDLAGTAAAVGTSANIQGLLGVSYVL